MDSALFERMLAEEKIQKGNSLKFISVFFVIPPHQLCFITLMSNPFRFFALFSLVILSPRTEAKQNPHYLAADTLQIDSVFYSNMAQDTIYPHTFSWWHWQRDWTVWMPLSMARLCLSQDAEFVCSIGAIHTRPSSPMVALVIYHLPIWKQVEVPCFKFNFSAHSFTYEKNDELYQAASRKGMDLNDTRATHPEKRQWGTA